MASTSLQDFVKEQKRGKNGGAGGSSSTGNGGLTSSLSMGFDDLKSSLSNSVSGGGAAGSAAGSISSFFSNATKSIPGLYSSAIGGGSNSTKSEDPDRQPLVDGEDEADGEQTKKSAGAQSRWQLSDSAFGLTRTQRFIGFFACLLCGTICFSLAMMYIPVIILKSRKFVALYSLGSAFFVFSFALLWGPASYVKHLVSPTRIYCTLTYFGTLFVTLYCSLWLQSTPLTLVCCMAQFVSLFWFLLSYIPGGDRGLKFMTGICTRFVRGTATGGKSRGGILPM